MIILDERGVCVSFVASDYIYSCNTALIVSFDVFYYYLEVVHCLPCLGVMLWCFRSL